MTMPFGDLSRPGMTTAKPALLDGFESRRAKQKSHNADFDSPRFMT